MIRIEPAEVRWFRWGPKKGFYHKTEESEVAVKRGSFTALLSDWEASEGEYGMQTRLTLEFPPDQTTYYMWISGDHAAAFAAQGAGMWTFESMLKGPASQSGLFVLQADRVDDEVSPDLGILTTLFPVFPSP